MVADGVVMLVAVALVVAGLYYSDWAALGVWVAFVAGAFFCACCLLVARYSISAALVHHRSGCGRNDI